MGIIVVRGCFWGTPCFGKSPGVVGKYLGGGSSGWPREKPGTSYDAAARRFTDNLPDWARRVLVLPANIFLILRVAREGSNANS